MKRLIVLVIAAISIVSLWAAEKQIKLKKETNGKDLRSIVSELIATQDNFILRLYTNKFTDQCQITVTDETGQTVYSETVSIIPEQPYLFTLDNAEEGMYQLNIETEEAIYQGSFYLN